MAVRVLEVEQIHALDRRPLRLPIGNDQFSGYRGNNDPGIAEVCIFVRGFDEGLNVLRYP